MLTPSLLIVADLRGLRAFTITPNPNRAPGLHLLDTFEAQESHGRYQDKVTDRAGNFQSSGVAGASRQTGGTAEHPTIDLENDRRACKHVAAHINELIKREQPESWLLALPAQIQTIVSGHLDREALKHLTQTVHADLIRTEPSKIAAHFSALQPA